MDEKKQVNKAVDDLTSRKDQAAALHEIGLRNPEAAKRLDNSISKAFGSMNNQTIEVHESIVKFESVISLIKQNIKNSKGYINFNISEYVDDKNAVFDIKQRVSSIHQITISDMSAVNKIYKRHLRIQGILGGR